MFTYPTRHARLLNLIADQSTENATVWGATKRTTFMTPEMLSYIVHRYSEKHRAYHTLAHIKKMLKTGEFWLYRLIGQQRITADDFPNYFAAVLFHDIIYDPTRSDNEEQSAQEAKRWLASSAGVDANYVAEMILATKSHVSDDPLTRKLIDIDMSILSSKLVTYNNYARAVRKEYAFVPLDIYVEKRVNFLSSQLNREQIFYEETDFEIAKSAGNHYWRNESDKLAVSTATAHHNIAAEIGYLTQNPRRYLNEPQ